MVATIQMGWVPLVMVFSISNTEELYYSTNRTTMVATIVLTIVPIEVGPGSFGNGHFFLTYLFHKDRKIPYFSGGRQIYLTLLAWLLIQDKKSTRLNSIVSSPKQLLPAILFNKSRLHWCDFIGYILDSHSFSTKNKSKLHLFPGISFQFDNDLFTFDVISAINTTSSD